MSVSPEIAAAQAAYAARPFAASITTEGFSGTFRFDTLGEAHAYLRQQITRHGFLQYGVTNNWSNKGVRTSKFDTHVTLADGTEQSLEEAGIAAQTEGPAGRWVLLDEGEVLERRPTERPAKSVGFTLNGAPVIQAELHENGITTVMVKRRDEHCPFVVATWWPGLGTQWSWGHYCQDLVEAREMFQQVAERNVMRGGV